MTQPAPTPQPNTIQLLAIPPQIRPPAGIALLYYDESVSELVAIDSTGANILPGGGTPGDPSGSIQFNNNGVLAGVASSVVDPVADFISYAPNGPFSGFEVNPGNGADDADFLVSPARLHVQVDGASPQVDMQANAANTAHSSSLLTPALARLQSVDSTGQNNCTLQIAEDAGSLSRTTLAAVGIDAKLEITAAGAINVATLGNGQDVSVFSGGGASGGNLNLQGVRINLTPNVGDTAFEISDDGAGHTTFGAFGHSPSIKPTVSGSKGANAALTSLIAALVALGWIIDTTT
jgi:hypothetical protein